MNVAAWRGAGQWLPRFATRTVGLVLAATALVGVAGCGGAKNHTSITALTCPAGELRLTKGAKCTDPCPSGEGYLALLSDSACVPDDDLRGGNAAVAAICLEASAELRTIEHHGVQPIVRGLSAEILRSTRQSISVDAAALNRLRGLGVTGQDRAPRQNAMHHLERNEAALVALRGRLDRGSSGELESVRSFLDALDACTAPRKFIQG